MFEEISSKEAKQTLMFIFDAAVDIEMEKDQTIFVEKVLKHARRIFEAPAGSIAFVDGDFLDFLSFQNDEIDTSSISRDQNGDDLRIPLNHSSIAGHVAMAGELLQVDDPYHLSESVPYKFDGSIDKLSGFKTESILAIPLRHPTEGIIGALEIINPKEELVHELNLGIAKSFAVMSAVSIINMRLQESLRKAYLETLARLGYAAEYKDEDTFKHIQRIRYSSKILGRELGLSIEEQEGLFHASAMHDVGKVGIPDAILGKNGKLDADEWVKMKSHSNKGASILRGSDTEILKLSEEIALHHHEKWNGNGYPDGLKGEEIPLAARIVAVADVFDALVNERPYKKAWPLQDALSLIKNEKGAHFDPQVVDAFFNCLDEILEIQEEHQ
ncbi:HD domain-containing phosphohydrolase [Mariprofundus sp. KV]|uniref:HD domain-containing phosphohydrolase n=1 Tax=Mariprofundus sp. KV TaxID=2608715 RepID=UPI0015A2687C|nr:HD domain-containing protein [Mariprofundus sp. KV]